MSLNELVAAAWEVILRLETGLKSALLVHVLFVREVVLSHS